MTEDLPVCLDESERVTLRQVRALEKAMKEGYVSLKNIKMVICGPPCIGKTAFKNLLLNNPPPLIHHSTPIAARPVQAIERIAAGEKVWEEVREEDLLHLLSDTIEIPSHIAEAVSPVPLQAPITQPSTVTYEFEPLPEYTPAPIHAALASSSAATRFSYVPTNATPQLTTDVETASKKIINQLSSAKKRKGSQKLLEATWIHLLDSGGQPQFTDLLRMFVRDNSLYIIAMKATESLHDKPTFVYSINGKRVSTSKELTMTNLQIIEKFVRSVAAATRDPKRIADKPAFAIVATHCDKLSKFGRKEIIRRANEMIQACLSEFLDFFIYYNRDSDKLIFPVDNLCRWNRKKISSDIRSCLLSSRSDISFNVNIPIRWYVFDLSMKEEASKEKHGIISLEFCYYIGSKFSMSKGEVDQCLIYLDSMRLCIYYPTVLPNVVFTSPQFLIDSLSNIVRVSFVEDLKQILPDRVTLSDDIVHSLKRDGVFDDTLLNGLGLTFVPNLFSKSDLLLLLQLFHLISPIKASTDTPQYFIPILLPVERLTKEQKTLFTTSIDPLVITFNVKLVLQVSH